MPGETVDAGEADGEPGPVDGIISSGAEAVSRAAEVGKDGARRALGAGTEMARTAASEYNAVRLGGAAAGSAAAAGAGWLPGLGSVVGGTLGTLAADAGVTAHQVRESRTETETSQPLIQESERLNLAAHMAAAGVALSAPPILSGMIPFRAPDYLGLTAGFATLGYAYGAVSDGMRRMGRAAVRGWDDAAQDAGRDSEDQVRAASQEQSQVVTVDRDARSPEEYRSVVSSDGVQAPPAERPSNPKTEAELGAHIETNLLNVSDSGGAARRGGELVDRP